jgi:hypothetical protein
MRSEMGVKFLKWASEVLTSCEDVEMSSENAK